MESDSAKKILSFLIRIQNSPLNVATYKFFRRFMQRTDWKIFMFKYFFTGTPENKYGHLLKTRNRQMRSYSTILLTFSCFPY